MVFPQLWDMFSFYQKYFLLVARFGCKGLQRGRGEEGHKEDGRGDKTDEKVAWEDYKVAREKVILPLNHTLTWVCIICTFFLFFFFFDKIHYFLECRGMFLMFSECSIRIILLCCKYWIWEYWGLTGWLGAICWLAGLWAFEGFGPIWGIHVWSSSSILPSGTILPSYPEIPKWLRWGDENSKDSHCFS